MAAATHCPQLGESKTWSWQSLWDREGLIVGAMSISGILGGKVELGYDCQVTERGHLTQSSLYCSFSIWEKRMLTLF